ncbi:hypothetical protein CEXT_81171, partial [Caerostris extrusa]
MCGGVFTVTVEKSSNSQVPL